jgi:hypothetical protein
MMQRYWWDSHEQVSKIHRLKWENMGLPKSQGGLGFRDLENFSKVFQERFTPRSFSGLPTILCLEEFMLSACAFQGRSTVMCG